MNSIHQAKADSRAINQEISDLLAKDQRIHSLCVAKAGPFLWAAATDWAAIGALIVASTYLHHPAAYVLACLLIAGRQHGFFALSHEAAHYRITGNKPWNDILGNALFAYPVLFDTDGYRQNHLKHHGYLNSDQDPDWKRKVHLKQWQFPMAPSFVLKTFPKFVLWNGPKEWIMIMLQLARVLPLKDITQPESRRRVGLRLAYYAALAAPLTYFSLWGTFFAYWVVPLVFFFPTIQRIRSVAEHFGLAREHDLNQTRNVMAPWYERILFGPHNINYHLDHHLISSVPFYNLPKLHEILMENETYRRLGHENTSYLMPSARPLSRDLFKEPQGEAVGAGNSEKIAA